MPFYTMTNRRDRSTSQVFGSSPSVAIENVWEQQENQDYEITGREYRKGGLCRFEVARLLDGHVEYEYIDVVEISDPPCRLGTQVEVWVGHQDPCPCGFHEWDGHDWQETYPCVECGVGRVAGGASGDTCDPCLTKAG